MELVNGIAAASGGQCVLLAEGERLQTKVCTFVDSEVYVHVYTCILVHK